MPSLRGTGALPWVVFLVVVWYGVPSGASAQAPKALVVLTDAVDEEPIRRIGNNVLDVEVLLRVGIGPPLKDYQECSDRVKRLRDFRFLFYREDSELTAERFWRQRLTAANPNGKAYRLPRSRVRPEAERRIEQARMIHEALSAKLPHQREQLDANLKSELSRLYSLNSPLLLAESK